jgi:hypothetical protein
VDSERYVEERDARRRELAGLPSGIEMAGKLEALLFERDPARLNFEVNVDEYRSEAEKVTIRLPSAGGVDGVVVILREEFRSFGGEVMLSQVALRQLAVEVWELWEAQLPENET